MLSPIRKLVKFTSSSTGAKITVASWLILVFLLSMFAPSAKDYEANSTEGSVREDTLSEIASEQLKEQFPTDDGLTALLVFYKEDRFEKEDIEGIQQFSEWLESDNKPQHIASALPFHHFPEDIQSQMFSEDETTLIFNLALKDDIDASTSHETLEQIRDQWSDIHSGDIQLEITGPAGISADTISLFKNADIVLMLATVGLIFIILIFIYRSPILAITPLIIAAIVYGVVDRILGLLGKYDVFPIEGQAVSIMLVLLFAVVTDYSLFVFSRYREELYKQESKYKAMDEAIYHVSEPIFFSGGTVTLAMLALFATVFNPYNHFAPVFSVAVIFILVAGLTLIPAIFAILGRRAFWPLIPKAGEKPRQKRRFWNWAGKTVVKHPGLIVTVLSIVFLIGSINLIPMNFSFNLLKSFPEDISSRVGFEQLEASYPAGELAPVTVLLEFKEEVEMNDEFLTNVQDLQKTIVQQEGIRSISSNSELTDATISGEQDSPRNFVSETNEAIKFQLILASNPYEKDALQAIDSLRTDTNSLLTKSGFEPEEVTMHISGQTAEQLDVQKMNNRDIIVLFSLVTVLLTVVLGFQTKSFSLPILMMGTILLSYVATLGFSWMIIHYLFGYESVSYRLPVYAFVFMVALGIDYNIMLVSRIKEFAEHHTWKEAIQQGVAATGGVISSAGLILAATFSVLITQPIQELFLFGFIMAMGILLDTFVIRGFFLPSILVLMKRK